jgi:hypothetical protein
MSAKAWKSSNAKPRGNTFSVAKSVSGKALAAGLLMCAEHVDLLGGASPLFNLMEVKNE